MAYNEFRVPLAYIAIQHYRFSTPAKLSPISHARYQADAVAFRTDADADGDIILMESKRHLLKDGFPQIGHKAGNLRRGSSSVPLTSGARPRPPGYRNPRAAERGIVTKGYRDKDCNLVIIVIW